MLIHIIQNIPPNILTRKEFVPENFAAIRHIALNLLRNNKTFKESVKTKRLNTAMDQKYLEEVMFG